MDRLALVVLAAAGVIRARHCQHLAGVPVQDICGTVAFTIAAPTLLAG